MKRESEVTESAPKTTMRVKLSKRSIDALKPHPTKDVWVYDTDLQGFCFRLKPSGSGYFLIRYKTKRGEDRKLKLAKLGAPPDEVRNKAKVMVADIAQGHDPVEALKDERAALSVAELCEKYLEAARAGQVLTRFGKPKRASTVAIDEGRVSRHIVPLIGKSTANDLTPPQLQRLYDDIVAGRTRGVFKTKARGKAVVEGGTGTAARVVELLGGIWTWAEKRRFVKGANPAHGVDKEKGEAKDRNLSVDELATLGQALRDHEARWPATVAALRLIALTGLRREEACGLRWSEIDKASACLRLTATKTGRSMRPIGKAAFDVLDVTAEMLEGEQKAKGVFVFPNTSGKASADLKKGIAAIFDAAGLKDARAHDLRRTFASVAANAGYGDASIGELLGHAKRGVTERHYIRRADAALIAAADTVSERIAMAMAGKSADVILLKRQGDA
jgi:integrase